MAGNKTAIRLGTEGKAEVKQDFAEVRRDGEAAFQGIEQAAEQTATASERAAQRQIDAWKRQAAAAKVAAVSGQSQGAFNTALSDRGNGGQFATVSLDRSSGAAREAAEAFEAFFREEERAADAAAKIRAALDPLWAAQVRYDQEIERATKLKQAGALSDELFTAEVDRAGKALDGARRQLEDHSKSLGLNRMQHVVGAGAARNFFDSVLAGASPMRAFMQQAGDVVTVLQEDDGGLAGGLAKVGRLLNPTTIGIAAVTGATVAGVAAWLSYTNALDKLTALSMGSGRVIGATAGELEANAEAAAAAGNISVSAAREIEQGYVQMGGVAREVLTGLTTLTTNFAAATGQDSAAALQQLGAAFQDPAEGADQLAEKYGVLDQRTLEHIHDLVEQNDRLGAQRALLAALEPAFDGAADHANILARAWRAIGNAASDAWTSMGKAIDVALGGGATMDKLNEAFRDRDSWLKQTGGVGDTSFYDKQIADLRAQLEREKTQGQAAQARAAGVRAMKIVDGVTGDDGLGDLRTKLSAVTGVLADGGKAAGLTADQLTRARTAQEQLTHAVTTYLPEGEKQVQMARLDAQIAATKDPARKAELTAQKSRLEQSGKLITAAEAEAKADADGARAKSAAAQSGASHAAQLAREAAAMTASANAALDVAAAYLESGAAGAHAEERRKALTEATRKGIDVEAQVRRELALSVAEGIARSAQSVSDLRVETAARSSVNDQVSSGALAVGLMNQAMSDEAALRPLLKLQALAQGDALAALTRVVDAYRKSLADAHGEEAHSQALQSLDALKKRIEDARLSAQFAGDTSGAADRARARLAGNREADARGYDGDDRADVVAGNVDAASAELTAKRAESAADMLRTQQESQAVTAAEIVLVGKSAEEHDRVIARLQLQQQLARDLGDEYDHFAPALLAAADASAEEAKRLKQLQGEMAELRDAGDRFVDAVFNPDGSGIKGLLKEVGQELLKLAAINPLKNLISGGNAPTLGSVFKSVTSLFGAGASLNTDWGGLGSDIAAFAGHNASGTENWSGGMTWVGEFGPELLSAPRGARITNAQDSRRLLAGANDVGSSNVTYDLRGSVVYEDLLAKIEARAQLAEAKGAAGGADLATQRADRRAYYRMRR